MASEKKGFVLYFDSWESLAELSAAQRGELLAALFVYASEVCRADENPLSFVRRFTGMEPDTRMAFCFMANAIRRDTQKWLSRQQNCRKAALQRTKDTEEPLYDVKKWQQEWQEICARDREEPAPRIFIEAIEAKE